MQDRINLRINWSHDAEPQESRKKVLSAYVPRVWMIMIALAIPFLIISSHYFETLERTGAIEAFLADLLLPATNIAYMVILVICKKRKI